MRWQLDQPDDPCEGKTHHRPRPTAPACESSFDFLATGGFWAASFVLGVLVSALLAFLPDAANLIARR